MTEAEKVVRILNEVPYLSLATIKPDGAPWVSTLFYAYDKDLTFYWGSKEDSLHSQNIRNNKQVAMNMYWVGAGEDNVDALYIEATAIEINTLKDISGPLLTYAQRLLKSNFLTKQSLKPFISAAGDYLAGAPFRLYKAIPSVIHKWAYLPNWKDKLVDGRIQVPINDIKTLL